MAILVHIETREVAIPPFSLSLKEKEEGRPPSLSRREEVAILLDSPPSLFSAVPEKVSESLWGSPPGSHNKT